MDPTAIGPLDWLAVPVNLQGLALALVAALCMSAANLLVKSAGLATVLASVLMAVVLTVIAIPFAVMFKLAWPWWSLIGLLLGVASLRVPRTLDAFAAKLEERLPGAAADRVTHLVRGDSPPEGD